MSGDLLGQEFVAYVWAAVDGPTDAIRAIDTLWNRCVDHVELTAAVGTLPDRKPDDLVTAPATEGHVIAARERPGPGAHQIVLRRVHDVLVLGLLRSPGEDDSRGWPRWEQEWEQLLGRPDPGWLGTARILQARWSTSGTDLVADGAFWTQVAAAARADPPATRIAGTLETSERLGTFAVWEASVAPPKPSSWDQRAHRRLVVVAPEPNDAELSAWTWSRGTPEQTPLAAYLMHAAKVRYAIRILPTDDERRSLLHDTDTAIAELVELVERVAAGGASVVDDDALAAASTTVRTRQAREVGLISVLGRRRRLTSVVDIAARNMAAHLDLARPGGVFADDAALAAWLATQMRNQEASLQDRLDRGRSITEQADRLVQARLQDRAEQLQLRRERFNLAATGAVGAVLMVLAAIQALAYKAPVPDPVKGPVVAALGSFALLCSVLVLRTSISTTTRWWPRGLVALAGVLLGASVGWGVVSAVGRSADQVAPASATGLGAAIGASVALVATIALLRGRHRPPGATPPVRTTRRSRGS